MAEAGRRKRVHLHIGAPKTGTTYLQAILAHNRDALAARGVLYPRSRGDAHHKAVWDLRGTPPQREGLAGIEGSWQALVDEVNAATSDVVLSSEHFVFARDPQVRAAVSAFDAEVHVVYTARDLVRQVPAVWQERVKNQKSISYPDFVESVMAGQGRTATAFWHAQDAAAVLDRWAVDLPASRVHLVTGPPKGAPTRALWDRFAAALGLGDIVVDLAVDGPANTSLTMVQTEVLRRFNERFADALSWPEYRRLIFRQLDVLRAIDDDRRIGLTAVQRSYFANRAEQIAARVAAGGYPVEGALSDLTPEAGEAEPAPALSDAELLGASLDVMRELLDQRAEVRAAAREARRARRGGADG